MLPTINHHPFAVRAFFDYSLVLTYAFPKEELRVLLPNCFHLSTYQEKWAFLAVALVKTNALRPNGFPKLLGRDFFLGGYRLFVNYRNREGVFRRGLYSLKSVTDKKQMQWAGNLFTQYNYSTQPFTHDANGSLLNIQSAGGLCIQVDTTSETLPKTTVFSNEKEARRFQGPMPYTFSFDERANKVVTVKGVRNRWQPKLVRVLSAQIPFFRENGLQEPRLANAFLTNQIDYKWNNGEVEKR